MAHSHAIKDTDTHFKIDTVTRAVTNTDLKKLFLMQNDHNSERFSFEMDRYVEGHDMSLCDKVEIHYINIGTNRHKNPGVYVVEDFKVSDADENKLTFSWLISENATTNAGSLSFIVVFTCLEDDVVLYRWNTDINKSISIAVGMNNGEAIEERYPDILVQWKNDLYAAIFGAQEFVIGPKEPATYPYIWFNSNDGKIATMTVRDGGGVRRSISPTTKIEAVEGLTSALTKEKTERETFDAVIEARVNTITRLPNASTSGDAELIDIRVGVGGNEYVSAGKSVRDQITALKRAIFTPTEHPIDIMADKTAYVGTFFNVGVRLTSDAYAQYSTSEYIPVRANAAYRIYCDIFSRSKYFRAIGITKIEALDFNKKYLSNITVVDENKFVTPSNCAYIVISSDNRYWPNYDNMHIYQTEGLVNPAIRRNLVLPDNLSVDSTSITDGAVERRHANFMRCNNPDIFVDKRGYPGTFIYNGKYIYNLEDYSTFSASLPFEVEASTQYTLSETVSMVVFYNSDYDYLSNITLQGAVTFTTPENTAYCAFCTTIEPYTIFPHKVIKGNSYAEPVYTMFGVKVLESDIVDTDPNITVKWAVIGDSITETNFRSTKNYHGYISDETGYDVTNYGVSGVGYKMRESDALALYQTVANVSTDFDIITIMCGVNDVAWNDNEIGTAIDSTSDTICGCINLTIDELEKLYPIRLPLGIISPLPCSIVTSVHKSPHPYQMPDDPSCRLSVLVDRLAQISRLRGYPFLDLFHTSGLRPDEDRCLRALFKDSMGDPADGLHPNAEGHRVFYKKIKAFLSQVI